VIIFYKDTTPSFIIQGDKDNNISCILPPGGYFTSKLGFIYFDRETKIPVTEDHIIWEI
jgi:hypothetical protein